MTEYFKCLGCGQTNAWANRAGEGFCRTCYVTAKASDNENTDFASAKTTTQAFRDATISELTRQRYAPQRMTILKELQRHIRNPADAAKEPEQIPFSEFDSPLSPLSPFLKEPKAK